MNSFYTELGALIKSKRQEAGLSMDEFAYRCSMHINGIWKIENAKSEIKISTLIKIFRELKLDFSVIQQLINKNIKNISNYH